MSLMYQEFLKQAPEIIMNSKKQKMKDDCFQSIKQATPIVFEKFGGGEIIEPISDDKEINLPFDHCFYEIIDNSVILQFVDVNKNSFHIIGIYVSQKSPKEFNVLLFGEAQNGKMIISINDFGERYRYVLLNAVYILTERFHNEHKGFSSPRTSVKVRDGNGNKHFHRINKVVYVSGKKSAASFGMQEREIDWSHRWEVRGHWRRIEGLGRDRHDQQIVKGYTWIKNYIKGDKNLPLVKKVRLVQ